MSIIRTIAWSLYFIALFGFFYVYLSHRDKDNKPKDAVSTEKVIIKNTNADVQITKANDANDRKLVLNISCNANEDWNSISNYTDSTSTVEEEIYFVEDELADNSQSKGTKIIESKIIESKVIPSTID